MRPVCSHCADIIGVYEPVGIKLTDGSPRESSLLNLVKDTPLGATIIRIWHRACLATEAVVPATDT